MLGLRPWLAFFLRALFFFFCVRFDTTTSTKIEAEVYWLGRRAPQS